MVVVTAKTSVISVILGFLHLVEGVIKEIIGFCCDINAVTTRITAMAKKALVCVCVCASCISELAFMVILEPLYLPNIN